jgi:RimJ/RimL family protein N-acetyltransferase
MNSFLKENYNVVVDIERKIVLRSATLNDNENLRKWKNSQKMYFFYQDEIDQEMQNQWFAKYCSRELDIMVIIEINKIPIGCMAIRFIDDKWDIYNVILGEESYGGKGFMGMAFKELLKLGLSIRNKEISLNVLKHNPAVNWYLKQGFTICEEHEGYYYMIFND